MQFFSYNTKTDNYDIYLTDGHVNSSLGDYNDFECITYHESVHRKNVHMGTIATEEIETIIQTTKCDAWNNATDNYIRSQASYAASQLTRIRAKERDNYLHRMNEAFRGYAMFKNSDKGVQVTYLLPEIICTGKLRK